MKLLFVFSGVWFLHWLCLVSSRLAVIATESVSPAMQSTGSWITWDLVSLSRGFMFEIELDNRLDEKEYLVTLFHELVHIEQRLRQRHQHRIAYLKRGGTVWQGEFYDGDTPYDDQPWAVEAFAKQYDLYEEYAKLRKP